jgi:nucleotide-binding universal stress UspA family protein
VLRATTADHISPDAGWPIVVAPEGYRDSTRSLRKVGVAFDGSDEARFALDWAVGVASEISAGMRLIAVAEPPPPPAETWAGSAPAEAWSGGLSMAMTEDVLEEIRARMQQNLARARSSIDEREVETVTVVGDATRELRDAAVDLGLLVVGSHSRGRLESVLMGSVSHGLVHSCPSPLAVVPFYKSSPD